MTIAASFTQSPRLASKATAGSFWRRLGIIVGFVSADLTSFVVADLVLQWVGAPPALGLFRGQTFAAPNTVIDLMAIIALLFVVSRYLAGDYSRRQLFWDGARATTGALLIWCVVFSAAIVIVEPAQLLPSLLVWFGLMVILPVARQTMRLFLAKLGIWRRPTAIIGSNQTAGEIYPVLSGHLSLGFDVRWLVFESTEYPVPASLSKLTPVNVPQQQVLDFLLDAGCAQVILVPDERHQTYQSETIDEMVGANIAVAIVPSLRRLPLFGLSASYFFGRDLLLLQVRNNLSRLPQRAIKRTIDVVGGVGALILLWPLFLTLAILIKLEDGGPVMFKQDRVGRNGRCFRCWKFRTMTVDAEDQLVRWARDNPALLDNYRKSNFKLRADPRVTRIGQHIRRMSLDELPQLFNVVLGDMSLVGPRPLIPRELADYGAVINLYNRVRPGITGLWQISGRSHTTFAQRISYDEWYIKNWTVWYDMVIMLRTIRVMFCRDGAY
jgi:undecaprenyl-phosphate galactose phosphotransferase